MSATSQGGDPEKGGASLARRTISRMVLPSIRVVRPPRSEQDVGTAGMITFTRDVVQTVEQGEEPFPPAERDGMPYLESYQDGP